MEVEHIGIAVKNIEKTIKLYQFLFPDAEYYEEILTNQAMRVIIVKGKNIKIELLQPLNSECTINNFIMKKGEGLHHIAFKVGDVNKSMSEAKDIGIRLLTEKAYLGAEKHIVCFMHPKDTNGVLYELCQCDNPTP